MRLSRRTFTTLLGGAFGGLVGGLPRTARAATSNGQKFLFVYVPGGWDPTYVFAPVFGSSALAGDPEGYPGSANGIDFVDSDVRPSVRAFFEAWGDRAAILNGFEVRSITHERCRRLLFTGGFDTANADDWLTIAAGHDPDKLLPHLVLTGPAYSSRYSDSVIRLGERGQLASLIDGRAFEDSDVPIVPLPADVAALVDARVGEQLAAAIAQGPTGRSAAFLDAYGLARDRAELLAALAGEIDLAVENSSGSAFVPVPDRVAPALTCFERDYARCAIVEHAGLYEVGWDTHAANSNQSVHYELLFSDLTTIVDELAARPGVRAGSLLDEVTVVVVSEMGRTPTLNSTGGKDHWTWTSALLIGGRTRGGQVVGGYDDGFLGQRIDLASGAPASDGTSLRAASLGATLLAMADVDPGEFTSELPIEALIG